MILLFGKFSKTVCLLHQNGLHQNLPKSKLIPFTRSLLYKGDKFLQVIFILINFFRHLLFWDSSSSWRKMKKCSRIGWKKLVEQMLIRAGTVMNVWRNGQRHSFNNCEYNDCRMLIREGTVMNVWKNGPRHSFNDCEYKMCIACLECLSCCNVLLQ